MQSEFVLPSLPWDLYKRMVHIIARPIRLKQLLLISTVILSFIFYLAWTGSGPFAIIKVTSENYYEDFIFKSLPEQTFTHQSEVEGYLFNNECVAAIYNGQIQASLLQDFSPFVEKEIHKRFVDILGNINYCVMSPAFEQNQGKVLIAFRACRCTQRQKRVSNSFQQDLVYIQEYTRELRPSGPGYFIAYGYPKVVVAEHLPVDGPQDPRAFKLKGRLYLIFHDGVPKTSNRSHPMIRTILWDVEANRPTVLVAKDNVFGTNVKALADKNWMPLVINDTLYFIQYLDPLLVVKCNLNGSCEYVPNLPFTPSDPHISSAIDPLFDVLHGGTPFKHYSDNYHIGLVHCKYTKSLRPYQVSAYTSHIILFNSNTFRIVFISGHIPLNAEFYRGRQRQNFTLRSFYFPTGMVMESLDSLLVFAHVNDDSSCAFRISGVEKLLRDVIKRDKTNSTKAGPPVGCIQKLLWSRKSTYIKLQTTIN